MANDLSPKNNFPHLSLLSCKGQSFATPSPLLALLISRPENHSYHMSEIFDLFLSKPVVGLTVHTVCYV